MDEFLKDAYLRNYCKALEEIKRLKEELAKAKKGE